MAQNISIAPAENPAGARKSLSVDAQGALGTSGAPGGPVTLTVGAPYLVPFRGQAPRVFSTAVIK